MSVMQSAVEGGCMSIKLQVYNCLKCGRPVELMFIPGMSHKTWTVFKDMMGAGLCRDCFCEKHIPEAAEKLLEGLWIH
jgi:NMD protein affecting ribosome stability and mRNA decay